MARLLHLHSQKEHVLNIRHVIGRDAHTSNCHIDAPDVSSFHAHFRWFNNKWELKDQSRNGTLVNNKLILKNTLGIKAGDLLQFGKNPNTQFKVLSDDKPNSYLLDKENDQCIELIENQMISLDTSSESTIYRSVEGKWLLENHQETIALENSQRYYIANILYEFIENDCYLETLDYGKLAEHTVFKFTVSPDEEHISFSMLINEEEIIFPDRSHNYVLYRLAQLKLDDPYQNDGWCPMDDMVDDISKEMLEEKDQYYVNTCVFNARKLSSEITKNNLYVDIIKRRKGLLQFGFSNISIIKET